MSQVQQKNQQNNTQSKNQGQISQTNNKNQQQQTPFLLQQDSFKSNQQNEQLFRQKQMMNKSYQQGRQLLIKKQYLQASKQLSKTVMTFQYIVKNHTQTISKTQVKQMMIQTILPAYNNLSLCYVKLKNYQMVVAFTNQVLGQDPDNIKARYRRSIAYKQTKMFDLAQEDLNMVIKLDESMRDQCQKIIKQCKLGEIQEKKKRKKTAERFISGYEGEKRYQQETKTWEKTIADIPDLSAKKNTQKQQPSQGILGWVRQKCQKCKNIFAKKQHTH